MRGCIVDSNLSVLALVIVKKGEQVCLILFKEILYLEVYLITFQSGSTECNFPTVYEIYSVGTLITFPPKYR